MSAVNLFEDEILDLLFVNEDMASVGDAGGLGGSTAAGSIQVSLATVDYEEADTLLTADEAAYTSYDREDVARSGAGWTVLTGSVSNAALITFTEATGGSETETCYGLGWLTTNDRLDMFGLLDSDLAVSTGIIPEFAIGALVVSLT